MKGTSELGQVFTAMPRSRSTASEADFSLKVHPLPPGATSPYEHGKSPEQS